MPFIGESDRNQNLIDTRTGGKTLITGSPERKKTVRFDGAMEIDLAHEEALANPETKQKIFINNPPMMASQEVVKEVTSKVTSEPEETILDR